MQVSVEAPNKLQRRLTITIPTEKVEEIYDKRIVNLSKTAKVNGFRQGKIPLDYIKQRYGESVRKEALSEVIQKFLYEAIHQERLTPVGVPQVEPKAIIPGQPLEFIATFEVFPEIEGVQFELTQLDKQITVIAENDVDFVVENLRKQHTKWQLIDRAAAVNDQVVVDFKGAIAGVPIAGGEAKDYGILLGSNTMIPGFEEGILGLSAGEEKTLLLQFPENYFSKDYAGKDAEFTIKVKKVLAPIVPDLDEAFMKKMGIKSAEMSDFRAEIRKNLERESKRIMKEKLKKQVFDHLIEKNPLDVPATMVQREAKRIHDELHPHHAGNTEHQHTDAENAAFTESARRNIILGLLVAKLLKQHAISLDKDRVAAHITQLAAIYEDPQETIKWYETDQKAKKDVEMYILEEQLVEKLLENVKINEVMLSYNELVNPQVRRTS